MAKKRTRNLGNVIRAKLAADTELAKAVDEEWFNADIAQKVYDRGHASSVVLLDIGDCALAPSPGSEYRSRPRQRG